MNTFVMRGIQLPYLLQILKSIIKGTCTCTSNLPFYVSLFFPNFNYFLFQFYLTRSQFTKKLIANIRIDICSRNGFCCMPYNLNMMPLLMCSCIYLYTAGCLIPPYYSFTEITNLFRYICTCCLRVKLTFRVLLISVKVHTLGVFNIF